MSQRLVRYTYTKLSDIFGLGYGLRLGGVSGISWTFLTTQAWKYPGRADSEVDLVLRAAPAGALFKPTGGSSRRELLSTEMYDFLHLFNAHFAILSHCLQFLFKGSSHHIICNK